MLKGERGISFHRVSYARSDDTGRPVPVLRDVDAVFKSGEITRIGGDVGAGKTTLLHLAAGLMRPDAGEIRVHGVPVSTYPAPFRDRWRKNVGLVFQDMKLLPGLTVLENIAVPLVTRLGVSFSAVKRQCAPVLDAFGLGPLSNKAIGALSGGQRQRVAAARALVGTPDFLIVDEPFAHQDESGVTMICGSLRDAATRGATVLVAAHQVGADNATFYDTTYNLRDGRLLPVEKSSAIRAADHSD